jgi:rhamnose transport system substrate-binding protein
MAQNRNGGQMDRLSWSRGHWRKATVGAALLLPVALAACSTGTDGSSAAAASKTSKVIVLIPKQTSDPFFTNAEQGAKEAARQLGYKIDYVGPTTADAAGQVTTIENAIRQHPAAITISGDDPNAVAPALKQAMKAGIVVSSYNADVATGARKFFISQASDQGIAQAIVDTMAAQTQAKGNFLLVTSTSTAANQNTWIAYMKKYIPQKYPHMHIAQIIPGNDDPATVLSVTSGYLAAHKSTTTGVWVIGGGMSGAIKAEKQQGINPHSVPVAGLCIPSDVKVDVNAGLIKNCVLWSPADTAYADVYAINAALKGKLPANGSLRAGHLGTLSVTDNVVNVGKPLIFTKENINNYNF